MKLKRVLPLTGLFAALLLLVPPVPWPAEAITGLCFNCVEHTWQFPDGTSETFVWCLLLGGEGGTGCYEINNGTACVLLFPGSCQSEPPPV